MENPVANANILLSNRCHQRGQLLLLSIQTEQSVLPLSSGDDQGQATVLCHPIAKQDWLDSQYSVGKAFNIYHIAGKRALPFNLINA